MGAPAQLPAPAVDVLFVGVTRPALRFGVPYAALLVNALVTLELFLLTRNLFSLLAALPIHAVVWALSAAEPRIFELLKVWALVRARSAGADGAPWQAQGSGPFGAMTRRPAPPALPLLEGPSC